MQIKIGVPSKGRLRKDVLKVFKNNQYNLISDYKIGDLTKVYPIARGTGPIVATIISIIFLGLLITEFQIISIGVFSNKAIASSLAISKELNALAFVSIKSSS